MRHGSADQHWSRDVGSKCVKHSRRISCCAAAGLLGMAPDEALSPRLRGTTVQWGIAPEHEPYGKFQRMAGAFARILRIMGFIAAPRCSLPGNRCCFY